MRIAVLALQGAFAEHRQMLSRLDVESFEVRQLSDWLQPKDGLIIPGGESTVQSKLLVTLGLMEPIRCAILEGLPVFGTCAGMILLAKEIDSTVSFETLSTMDVRVVRNAYGRQLGSFHTCASLQGIGDHLQEFGRIRQLNRIEVAIVASHAVQLHIFITDFGDVV